MLKTRLITASIILVLMSIGFFLFGGIPARCLIIFAFICASMETVSSYVNCSDTTSAMLRSDLWIFILISGAMFIFLAPIRNVFIILVGVCAADTAAYLFGKTFGGKLISTRPFSKTSPHKSWEGIIAAIVASACAVFAAIYIFDGFNFDKIQPFDYLFLSCGILSVIGDYLDSALKRACFVKDSYDLIPPNCRLLLFVEKFIGGKDGQGGYLDFIDSLAFASMVFFFVDLVSH